MGTINASKSKNIANPIPLNNYENYALSGGSLKSFKEVRWSNKNISTCGCTFELKYLVSIKIIKFDMNNVIHRSREGGSYT